MVAAKIRCCSRLGDDTTPRKSGSNIKVSVIYVWIREGRWATHLCVRTCGHTHLQMHTTPLRAFLFDSQPSLFNSRVVVSSLITLDNNLIRKRCAGIHCFSLITYPHLPVYPLPRSPLHGPLSVAPSPSISLTLCWAPPLSVTPAETPLNCVPSCLTWTVLSLTTFSKRSTSLH